MDQTKELRIRVTPELYSQLKVKAQLCGFKTMNAYVREKIMRFPYQMEKMVEEIYEKLIKTK